MAIHLVRCIVNWAKY